MFAGDTSNPYKYVGSVRRPAHRAFAVLRDVLGGRIYIIDGMEEGQRVTERGRRLEVGER